MEVEVIAMWEKALELMTDDEVFNLVKAEGLGELYPSVAGEAEDRGYWDVPGEQWRKAVAEEEERKNALPRKSHPRRPFKHYCVCNNQCNSLCKENIGN